VGSSKTEAKGSRNGLSVNKKEGEKALYHENPFKGRGKKRGGNSTLIKGGGGTSATGFS